MRRCLNSGEWRAIAGMAGAVSSGLHMLGFFILIVLVAPRHYNLARPAASRRDSASRRTRWACVTPSTPTTSRRSTTRPAS